jgi:hypothetical protein
MVCIGILFIGIGAGMAVSCIYTKISKHLDEKKRKKILKCYNDDETTLYTSYNKLYNGKLSESDDGHYAEL